MFSGGCTVVGGGCCAGHRGAGAAPGLIDSIHREYNHMDRPITAASPASLDLADLTRPEGQAFRLLHTGFTVAPILFGLDKFAGVLTDWTQYLAPIFPSLLGVSKQTFMYGVGVVEVAAGVLVALKPRYAAYVVAAWLAGIILNLLLLGRYLDVA